MFISVYRAGLYGVVDPQASKTAVYSGSMHILTREEDFIEPEVSNLYLERT